MTALSAPSSASHQQNKTHTFGERPSQSRGSVGHYIACWTGKSFLRDYVSLPTALSAETPLSPNPLASTAKLDVTRRSGNAWVLPRYTVRLPPPALPPTLPLLIVLVRREGDGFRRSSPPPNPSSDRKYRLHSSVPLRFPPPLPPKSSWAGPLVLPEPRRLSPFSRTLVLLPPPPSFSCTAVADANPESSDRLLCLWTGLRLPGSVGTSEAVARSSRVMPVKPALSCCSTSKLSDAWGSFSAPRLVSPAESPRWETLLCEEEAACRCRSSGAGEPATAVVAPEPRADALVGRPMVWIVTVPGLFDFLVVLRKPTSSSVRPITPGYATCWSGRRWAVSCMFGRPEWEPGRIRVWNTTPSHSRAAE